MYEMGVRSGGILEANHRGHSFAYRHACRRHHDVLEMSLIIATHIVLKNKRYLLYNRLRNKGDSGRASVAVFSSCAENQAYGGVSS